MTVEPSRRERKKDETRDRIFKEAIRLFRRRGFEETTIDEITERADVAKGTFFNYFPRKDSLLAFLSEKRLVAAEEMANEILASDRPATEMLLEIHCAASSAWEEDPELSQYVIGELLKRAFAPTEEIALRWQSLLLKLIEKGQASGELRRDLDPVRIESLLHTVYFSTVFLWTQCPESQFQLQVEIRERLRMVLDGLVVHREVRK